jgi:hypothetical protein
MTSAQLAATVLALRGDTVCGEQFRELLEAAIRYSRIRVDWAMLQRTERLSIETGRTAAHEVLIDSFNILSRAMLRAGESNEWRSALGTDRQVIGDVACHIHCMLGLGAR